MKYCCEGFRTLIANGGRRGVGAFYSTTPTDAFIIQFRASEPETQLVPQEGPLTLVDDLPIHFCPWCGAKLKKKYAKSLGELTRDDLRVSID